MIDLTATQRLHTDARNRALRSLLQGLAIDVLVAVVLVVSTQFGDANGWGDLQWSLLSFTLAKTVVQSIASFTMRRFLDASSIPTPLPPADPGEPDVETFNL